MFHNEYLNSDQGQKHQYLSRMKSLLVLNIKQEPKSKRGLDVNEKKRFRREVVDAMKKLNKRPFRSDIVLSIDFYSTQISPPSLQKLIKNYLDLLHKPMS